MENKVINLKPIVFISNLYENYKREQNDLMKHKINFLYRQAYRYFYDIQETVKIQGVDLPSFIYEIKRQKFAEEHAKKAMLEVIADKRVNECYSKRINQLKVLQYS